MDLKEAALYLSSAFQHVPELIKEFRGCAHTFVLLQGYGGHDCNCATPMNLVASLIMTVELELEHLV